MKLYRSTEGEEELLQGDTFLQNERLTRAQRVEGMRVWGEQVWLEHGVHKRPHADPQKHKTAGTCV